MNWKFTKLKIRICFTISIVITMVIIFSRLLEYLLLRLYGLFSGLDLACISDCRFIPSSSSVLSGFIFGLLGFLVTYLIWSLIQKKEIVEIQKKGTDDNIKEAQQ